MQSNKKSGNAIVGPQKMQRRDKAMSVGEQLRETFSRGTELVKSNSLKAREFMSKMKAQSHMHPPLASVTAPLANLLARVKTHFDASTSGGKGSSSLKVDDGKGAGRGWLNLPFAAITLDGSKGGKSLTPEGEKKLHKLLSEMTPEERSEFVALVDLRMRQDTPFDVAWAKKFTEPNGEQPFKDCKTWQDFYEAREAMEERILRGSGQKTFNGDLRKYWSYQSPRYAIPGLTEMELPAEEEAELELMMIGAGVIDGPVHPLLAPLYPRLRTVHAEVGIYARPDEVHKRLKGRYAMKDDGSVPNTSTVAKDLIGVASEIELTLCAHAVRDLPLKEVRELARPLIEASLEKRGATKADKEVAGAFLRQFDPSLIRAIWLDNRGKVARGTKLMVTTLDSGFHSEVISQGRLVDKTMTDFGECPSAAVGRAVFDAVMEGDRVKGLGESVASGVVTIASVGKGKKAATAAAKRALEERLPEIMAEKAAADAAVLAAKEKQEAKARKAAKAAKERGEKEKEETGAGKAEEAKKKKRERKEEEAKKE